MNKMNKCDGCSAVSQQDCKSTLKSRSYSACFTDHCSFFFFLTFAFLFWSSLKVEYIHQRWSSTPKGYLLIPKAKSHPHSSPLGVTLCTSVRNRTAFFWLHGKKSSISAFHAIDVALSLMDAEVMSGSIAEWHGQKVSSCPPCVSAECHRGCTHSWEGSDCGREVREWWIQSC